MCDADSSYGKAATSTYTLDIRSMSYVLQSSYAYGGEQVLRSHDNICPRENVSALPYTLIFMKSTLASKRELRLHSQTFDFTKMAFVLPRVGVCGRVVVVYNFIYP